MVRWLTFLCLCSTLYAEPSLQDYIDLAARDSNELQATYNLWQAALTDVNHSNTFPDPQLSYGLFVKEVETRVGPQKQRLGIRQMIPWFGKLKHRKGVAVQSAIVAEEQFCLQYASLVNKLRKAFYNYYYLHQAIQITTKNIQLLDLIERVAQSQARVGGSTADVLQARIETSKLQDDLETFRERTTIAAERINAILNRKSSELILLPSSLFDELTTPQKVSDAELEECNPSLRILGAEVGKHARMEKLARQNRYPDVTLGIDWIQTDRARMPTPGSGKDPVVATVSVNIPLWQSSYRSQEKSASYRKQSVQSQFTQQRYEVQTDLTDILLRYKETDRELALYQDTLIPQAEQTLSILEEAYEVGKVDFERYIGAQKMLFDFQLKREKARAEKASVVADYDFFLLK